MFVVEEALPLLSPGRVGVATTSRIPWRRDDDDAVAHCSHANSATATTSVIAEYIIELMHCRVVLCGGACFDLRHSMHLKDETKNATDSNFPSTYSIDRRTGQSQPAQLKRPRNPPRVDRSAVDARTKEGCAVVTTNNQLPHGVCSRCCRCW